MNRHARLLAWRLIVFVPSAGSESGTFLPSTELVEITSRSTMFPSKVPPPAWVNTAKA